MSKAFTFGHLHNSKEAIKLPVDVATEITAFIGRRGSGKSHGARVVVEGVLDAGQQVVVFDPLNIWWGLRLRKDGKTAAYDVYIFGGDHADQPLVEQSGVLIADFVIDTGSSVVLSMRHLSKAAMRRFVADFNERLMERKQVDAHRNVLLTVLDEADLFIPQRLQPEATRCFSVVDDLIRRGRASGVGTLMLSQRPAVINKDVLAMTEVMVCLQIVSPQDRKALLAWVEANATEDKGTAFTGTLPTLKRGEAIIWSPTLLEVFERILIKDTSTYDSSYTPKVGEKSRGTVKLKPVDMAKLTAQLQAVAKEVEENKPGKLKARIKELEKQLTAKGTPSVASATELATKMVANTLKIEIAKRDKQWGAAVAVLNEKVRAEVATLIRAMAGGDWDRKAKSEGAAKMHVEMHAAMPSRGIAQNSPHLTLVSVGKVNKSLAKVLQQNQDLLPDSKGDVKITDAHKRVLQVLAQYDGGRSREFVAAHAGYSANTGHYSNLLSALRKRQLIQDTRSGLVITPDGREALGDDFEPLPTGEALLEHWYKKLHKGEKLVLQELTGGERDRVSLAQATGYQPNTGHFSNCLSKLRSLNLIEGSRLLRLTPEFAQAIGL